MRFSAFLACSLPVLAHGSYIKRGNERWPKHSPYSRDINGSWPDTPLYTSGRDIKNARNETVTYAGVNWPGAADVMIPEGLQYQSISTIVSKIKALGMNVIRLTYAIEMVDDIYEGGDVSLEDALTIALGALNGSKVLGEILAANPAFTANTTRLQVWLDTKSGQRSAADDRRRCLMPSLQSVIISKSMCIWTTTSRKANGVVAMTMEMLGSAVRACRCVETTTQC